MRIVVGLSGLNEVQRVLDSIPREFAAKIEHQALTSGARVASRLIKKRTPVRTGSIRDTIEVRARSRRGRRNTVRLVSTAPHAHLPELGTKDRFTKSGEGRGKVKARLFFTSGIKDNFVKINNAIARTAINRSKGVLQRLATNSLRRGELRSLRETEARSR